MAQERRNSLEWGPMVMHVGAAGVAQQVGMIFRQSLCFCDLIQYPADGAHVQPFDAAVRADAEQQRLSLKLQFLQPFRPRRQPSLN